MATSAFPEWTEQDCPFNWLGFSHLGPFAPPAHEFKTAVNHAKHMTNPGRVHHAGSKAHGLPFTSAQVQQAIDYFTSSNGVVDDDVWEWAYQEFIVDGCRYQYSRTWRPEELRWEDCILQEPQVIDLTPTAQPSIIVARVDSPPPSRVSVKPNATPHVSEPAKPDAVPLRLHSDLPPARRLTGDANGPEPSSRKSEFSHTSFAPSSVPSTLWPLFNATRPREPDDTDYTKLSRKRKRCGSDRAELIKRRTAAAGQSARIFLGFHREQLRGLSPRERTRKHDFRQPVHGFINRAGVVQRKLSRLNLAGELIPEEYCLKGSYVASAKHDDTLYHGKFVGFQVDEVKKVIVAYCSQENVPEMPDWVPMVPIRAGGNGSADVTKSS